MFGTIKTKIPDEPGSYKIVWGNRPVGDDFSYPMSYFFGKCFTHLVVDDVPIGIVRDIQIEGDQMVGVWDYSRQDKHVVWDMRKQGKLEESIEIRLATIKNHKSIRRSGAEPLRLVTINVGVEKCVESS